MGFVEAWNSPNFAVFWSGQATFLGWDRLPETHVFLQPNLAPRLGTGTPNFCKSKPQHRNFSSSYPPCDIIRNDNGTDPFVPGGFFTPERHCNWLHAGILCCIVAYWPFVLMKFSLLSCTSPLALSERWRCWMLFSLLNLEVCPSYSATPSVKRTVSRPRRK